MERGAAGSRAEVRFAFGRNWANFLRTVSEPQIARARDSLREALALPDLTGLRFLDLGCGSGLFSLAAQQLGAEVVSVDLDPQCIACAETLRQRFAPAATDWEILRGSALDAEFLTRLGTFDVVYSWGVLHHTGQMWPALELVATRVAPSGRLFIAIYNDQGGESRRWTRIKRWYNQLPRGFRWLIGLPAFVRIWGPSAVRDLLRGRPFWTWRTYQSNRGMNAWHDFVDWVGGYPFEVARPEEIFDFFRDRGFELRYLKTCGGGRGCNEFVFRRTHAGAESVPGKRDG